MPRISTVIPVRNREEELERCLRALRGSRFDDYEIIVVDDGSDDATPDMAERYADRVIRLGRQRGRHLARDAGVAAATGEIVVGIDSDILVKPDTLARVAEFFSTHSQVDYVTGLLSREHPNPGFFSQYKNLYMHFIFRRLPDEVTFLYGSIFGFRREHAEPFEDDFELAEDTALGQKVAATGKRIGFCRDLEVVHLKAYGCASFFQNDFLIPFHWARVFFTYAGWKQLGRNRTGFAHAPKGQLASVVLAPLILLLLPPSLAGWLPAGVPLLMALCWFLLNARFLVFLLAERGGAFAALSVSVTFLDHLVMAAGIAAGLVAVIVSKAKR